MKLQEIQQTLKAPKGQNNKFGGYKYRNCEDILEAVKPLLGESLLTISDEMIVIGDNSPCSYDTTDAKGNAVTLPMGEQRFYIKATATFTDGNNSISVSAYARESESRKGMDDSQITGSTSSYARKFALNGLFLIDDTKDADTVEHAPQAPDEAPVELNRSAFGQPDDNELVAELKKVLAKAVSDMIVSPDKMSETLEASNGMHGERLSVYLDAVQDRIDKLRLEVQA